MKMREDKQRAIDREWRISEQELFRNAAFGGAIGTELAMYDLFSEGGKHKVSKASWRIGNVSLIVNHIILLIILIRFLYKTKITKSYFVARNVETGQLIYFRIGNVRKAKYIMNDIPPELLINSEYYLVSSKKEKPWLKV